MTRPAEEYPVTSDFVRSYVITRGRRLPSADHMSLHTLVTLAPGRQCPRGVSPEVGAIWELCAGGYLAVAEVAAHLGLPVGVARLLLTDLSEQGHLLQREAPPRAESADRETLLKVLHGLESLIG
jgi:hypothetical protein